MKKQILTCVIAAVMMLTAVWIPTTQPAAAASKKPFMSIQADSNEKPRDKVGKYYIWVEHKDSNSFLKCAQSLNGKKKTLAAIKGKKAYDSNMDETIITDGETIYYAVLNHGDYSGGGYGLKNMTVYKTTVKNTKPKKIAVIRPGGLSPELAAYYNGMLYGNVIADNLGSAKDMFAYDISEKKGTWVKQDRYGMDSYGQYILVGSWSGDPSASSLYNMKTKKFKKLPLKNMSGGVIYGKTIYFTEYKDKTNTTLIKKCNLSGKKVKTIKKLKNAEIVHMGKKAVYYKTGNSAKIKKVVY